MTATSQVDKYDPIPPPLPIGTRVRYTGENRWGRGDGTPDGPMRYVEPGDVAEVTSVHIGMRARPDLGGDLAEPLHGWSVATFPNGVTIALGGDDWPTARYEQVPG